MKLGHWFLELCYRGHERSMDVMLSRGVDPRDLIVNSPYALVIGELLKMSKRPRALSLLYCAIYLDINVRYPLVHLAMLGWTSWIGQLLFAGWDIDAFGPATNPLLEACLYGQTHVVEYLLDQGANINVGYLSPGKNRVGEMDIAGWNALERAAMFGYPETMKLLLERGFGTEEYWKTGVFRRTLRNSMVGQKEKHLIKEYAVKKYFKWRLLSF